LVLLFLYLFQLKLALAHFLVLSEPFVDLLDLFPLMDY